MCVPRPILTMLVLLRAAAACQGPSIRVSGGGVYKTDRTPDSYTLEARYGGDVTMYCTGNNSNQLNIKFKTCLWGGDAQETEHVNTTTIKLSLDTRIYYSSPFSHYDYAYICTDMETACESKLQITVLPLITIESPNALQRSRDYYIPVGEDYDVVCYGHPTLSIFDGERREIKTVSVNNTSIKSRIQATETNWFDYSCRYLKASLLKGTGYETAVRVHVHHIPRPENIFCVEFISNITCTWNALSSDINFTIFSTDKSNSIFLYDNQKKIQCILSLEDRKHLNETVSLLIQACNDMYCVNHTHLINRSSITKIESPKDFKLSKVVTGGAIVSWKAQKYDIPVEYRVTYKLIGVESHDIDASPHCYEEKCEIELKLPCPIALYEVKLYVKLTTTPRSNAAYWSEPVRTTFRYLRGPFDPKCDEEHDQITDHYAGMVATKLLGKEIEKSGAKLYMIVENDLKHKRAEIKEICRELSLHC